jgi:hypothetical protein
MALRRQLFQRRAVQRAETVQRHDFGGNLIPDPERFRLFQRGFTGFHRVDDIFFDLGDLCIRERSVQRIDPGRTDEGPFTLGENLDALGRGVCTLIELAGEILYGKDRRVAEIGLVAYQVQLGF